MSKEQSTISISPIECGTGKENFEFGGYRCGYCHGAGWTWNPDITIEASKVTCPHCHGTGKVKALVEVKWVPDGEIRDALKTE